MNTGVTVWLSSIVCQGVTTGNIFIRYIKNHLKNIQGIFLLKDDLIIKIWRNCKYGAVCALDTLRSNYIWYKGKYSFYLFWRYIMGQLGMQRWDCNIIFGVSNYPMYGNINLILGVCCYSIYTKYIVTNFWLLLLDRQVEIPIPMLISMTLLKNAQDGAKSFFLLL